MDHHTPPAPDDDTAYVFIDHREEEASIVHAVSDRLAEEHALQVEQLDEQMILRWCGQTHTVPLQMSPHDRYIMISSLAHLLREHYRFFVLVPSLDGDTHGLLVAPVAAVDAWGALPEHLTPLELGHDYFHQVRVPYLGGEDTAPHFAADRQRVANQSDAMAALVQGLFSGKITDDMAARMAAVVASDPAARSELKGMTEADMAAEMQKAFNEAMASPELAESRRELDAARAGLAAVAGQPRKPWWKFW